MGESADKQPKKDYGYSLGRKLTKANLLASYRLRLLNEANNTIEKKDIEIARLNYLVKVYRYGFLVVLIGLIAYATMNH